MAFYNEKGWYKSKPIWPGIATAVLGVLALFDLVPEGTNANTIVDALFSVLGLFTVYGRATATEKVVASPTT